MFLLYLYTFYFYTISILSEYKNYHDCCCISFCVYSPPALSVNFWSLICMFSLSCSSIHLFWNCYYLFMLTSRAPFILLKMHKVTSNHYLLTEQPTWKCVFSHVYISFTIDLHFLKSHSRISYSLFMIRYLFIFLLISYRLVSFVKISSRK